MASDMATTPVSGLSVQACGDAHMKNFGVFGSAERRLVFDVNDFDETLPGPWEWDVKRLAARDDPAAQQERRRAEARDAAAAAVERALDGIGNALAILDHRGRKAGDEGVSTLRVLHDDLATVDGRLRRTQ
jgi:uncharacterized protein (DUF2252 family)